jgi:hypothetical protein
MGQQEMPQRHEQLARMGMVIAPEGRSNIVAHHISDLLGTVLLAKEVVAKCGGGNLWNMLMLGDGEHFLLAQIAQCDAIV